MTRNTSVSATRGDTTRVALVRAAIEVFGRDGFEAAGTRSIAHAAGVNPALIGYHFRGKPGLYLAALEHIAEQVGARLGPLAEAIDAELSAERAEGGASPEQALQLLHRLTDAFVAMLTSEESAAWARLILREQQNPSPAFDVLYSGFMRRLLDVAEKLVGRIRGVDPRAVATRLTVLTIFGQVLVFRAARTTVMLEMEWPQIGPDEIDAIQATVRRNVTALLKQGMRP
jgi:TetR/AcrR family transcriptional regulator, regulator of cefoperazone and chloramphenicol sensitivity